MNMNIWKSCNSGLNGIRTRDLRLRVYYELEIDHLSMWLISSVGRVLHRYRKFMGSNPVQASIFFRLIFQLLKLKSHCEDHKFHLEHNRLQIYWQYFWGFVLLCMSAVVCVVSSTSIYKIMC